jgi:hypothetical protein
VREVIRARHYSPRTEKAYVHWIKRYIFFHGKRHPAEMGDMEAGADRLVVGVRHGDGHRMGPSSWRLQYAGQPTRE